MKKVIIGSRESRLAVIQSEMVKKYIEEHSPEIQAEILTMKTTGDIILDRTLDKIGGKAYGSTGGAAFGGLFQKRGSPGCAGPSKRTGNHGQEEAYRLFQPPEDPSAKGAFSGYGI